MRLGKVLYDFVLPRFQNLRDFVFSALEYLLQRLRNNIQINGPNESFGLRYRANLGETS